MVAYVVERVRIAVETEHSGGHACTLSSIHLHDNHARRHDAVRVAEAVHRTNNFGGTPGA
jgi:hypothetical protein